MRDDAVYNRAVGDTAFMLKLGLEMIRYEQFCV